MLPRGHTYNDDSKKICFRTTNFNVLLDKTSIDITTQDNMVVKFYNWDTSLIVTDMPTSADDSYAHDTAGALTSDKFVY